MNQVIKISTSGYGTVLSTKRELVSSADPILRITTPIWNFNSPPIHPAKLASEMIDALKEYKGLGLACPQVGLSYRMFVMGLDKAMVAFFNPCILEESKTTELLEEGCLSFPGLRVKICRPTTIHIAYQDYSGKHQESKFSGLTARIFQHETDHVNGVLFTDRAGKMALDIAKRKLHKQEGKEPVIKPKQEITNRWF